FALFPWPGFPRTTVRLTADRGANRRACSAFHQCDDMPVFALALVQRALILVMILAFLAGQCKCLACLALLISSTWPARLPQASPWPRKIFVGWPFYAA